MRAWMHFICALNKYGCHCADCDEVYSGDIFCAKFCPHRLTNMESASRKSFTRVSKAWVSGRRF
jgi:hypothetical protein